MTYRQSDIAVPSDWVVRIAQSLAGLVDLRAAVAAMSDELKRVLAHDHIDVALLTETGDELIAYETGLETTWGQKFRKVAASPIRDILQNRVPSLVFVDAMKDPRIVFDGADTEPIQKFGLRSRLHHKIEISGDTIGALSLSSRLPNVYSEDDLHTLRTVANVIGPYFHALRVSEIAKAKAVEAERQLALRKEAEHLIEVQEEERSRIGMDLHDHCLAELSRLLRMLDDDSLADQEKIAEAKSKLSGTIQDIRGIVEDARPALLEMFGLGTAIEAYLVNSARGNPVKTRMMADPQDLDLWFGHSQRNKLLIFRIAQEAINNAIRHADAQEISVSFLRDGDQVSIHVVDDGIGLNSDNGLATSGLQNMKARAEMMGALLHLSKAPSGRGTKVTLSLNCLREEA
ncbi:MAG: sensor histidine kinase [Cohaesibacter sp.]|nr:sensor histidine kinase [Cohaesibacter sp.]